MRVVVLALCVAAIAAPAASAKGQISVRPGNARPHVGQAFTVYVRTGYVVPSDDWLRLIAVAPNKDWFAVASKVVGEPHATASVPRDGFGVKLVRTGKYTWRAVVQLPRAGRWRLVVPNGTHAGIMMPPPSAWMPWVRVQA